MGKFFKGLKDVLGIEQEENYDEELILEENEPKTEIKNEKVNLKVSESVSEKVTEPKLDTSLVGAHEEIGKTEDKEIENCQTIFIDPKSFADCKKIANYIKSDRMVTLNLEYLDSETAQRMMDFLMGAMLIKGASFIEISKKVYTSVPKTVKVHYDGKKNINDRMYMNIREE